MHGSRTSWRLRDEVRRQGSLIVERLQFGLPALIKYYFMDANAQAAALPMRNAQV